ISDNADLRKWLRDFYIANATLDTKFTDTKSEKLPTYDMYKQYSEAVGKIPSHRILAINRGEADECLKVNFTADKEAMLTHAIGMFVKGESIFTKLIQDTAQDSLDRLILPSIEREMRTMLTDKADEQAIKMFQVNLKPLLMQPPLKGKVVMAVDPAYRTGCKIAVVDAQGNALDTTVVYVTPPQSKIEEGEVILTKLINK
ncbi:MAG: RNA-binding transcriptional accessory protein, partial [Clostridia bacterium]